MVKKERGTRTDYEPRSKKLQTVAGTVFGSPENCSILEKCMKMKTFGFLLETSMNFYQRFFNFGDKSLNN